VTVGRAGWQVGIDTGGTFTDLVARRGRETRIAKVPSTPPTFQDGVVASIVEAGIPFREIDVLCHGTTVATNALITRTGAPTALLTTEGFRDVLELRRHNRGELYDLAWDFPAPLVPRRHRFEVRERLAYDGTVVRRLEPEDVDDAVHRAIRDGITSFAVAFLHSYVNPAHEFAARDRILELAPGAFVYTSSELLREPGEFERTSTVVVNAYMGALVGRYLDALASRLGELGFGGHLFVMQSGGGLLTAATASRMPARLLTSGPAAGAMAAASIGRRIDPLDQARGTDVISLDIGGTSADIAVILDGRPAVGQEFQLEFGIPIRFPAIDLTTIGAGGGSIARVDAGGLAHVGPESAGAVPGPAAYGRGGTAPTLTDANVVLGRLPAGVALAGGVELDAAAATRAVDRFAGDVGLPRLEAAAGIVRIANANMARAIRVVTVQRGLDPRRFTLVAFGGAGGLHAAEVARELQIPRVVMPRMPGVTSALGCLAVAIEHDVADAYIVALAAADLGDVRRRFDELEMRVGELLAADGVDVGERDFETMIDLRFVGQLRSLTLPVANRHGATVAGLEAAFRREYERQFHYAGDNLDVEISALRVRGRGPLPRDDDVDEQPTTATEQADVDMVVEVHEPGGPVDARVVSRHLLAVGELLDGPAIVCEYDSTTWVPAGWTCTVGATGDLVMAVQAADLDPEESRHVVA
jgi:N-methylhydantoinase A